VFLYAGKQVDILLLEKRNDILNKRMLSTTKVVFWQPNFDNVAAIADTLTEKFVNGEYDDKMNWFTISLKCRYSNCSNNSFTISPY
jgi:hypothetical protein